MICILSPYPIIHAAASGGRNVPDAKSSENRTEIENPISKALSRVVERNAARPEDVYRLAVIVEGLMDSMDDPEAMQTIRHELRALINDLSQSIPGT
jgi:hypothetical protein